MVITQAIVLIKQYKLSQAHTHRLDIIMLRVTMLRLLTDVLGQHANAITNVKVRCADKICAREESSSIQIAT